MGNGMGDDAFPWDCEPFGEGYRHMDWLFTMRSEISLGSREPPQEPKYSGKAQTLGFGRAPVLIAGHMYWTLNVPWLLIVVLLIVTEARRGSTVHQQSPKSWI